MRVRVAILMASHNRREKTLRALASVKRQRVSPGTEIKVVLVDCGSIDGTADAAAMQFPETQIVRVAHDVYWGTAMQMAWHAAGIADHFIWMNDDVELFDDSLATVLTELARHSGEETIFVGSTQNPSTRKINYGGRRRLSAASFRFELVESDVEECCDTFNGNFALIPSGVYRSLGGIDSTFYQQLGDYDFGLRARERGVSIRTVPGCVGTCDSNDDRESFQNPGVSLVKRLSSFSQKKFYPPRIWWTYVRRHAPFPRFAYFLAPYLRMVLKQPLR